MPGWISLEDKPRLPQSSAEMQVGLESSMVIHLACFLSTETLLATQINLIIKTRLRRRTYTGQSWPI